MPPPTVIFKRATLEQDIDEFGDLQRQIDLMAPLMERHKVLKDSFEELLKDAPADKPAVLRGKLYELQLGPRRNERTLVNKRKAFTLLKARLGLGGLLAVIDIPMGKAIDPNFAKSEQAGMVVEERSGWRKLDVVALQPPAAPKAA